MSSGSARDRRVAEAATVGIMVLWAGNFIVVKGAVTLVPPVTFSFLRFGLAAIVLLILLRWREGALRLPHPDVIKLFALGALGFGAYQMLWTTGITTIPAGDSALLIAATPVLTALFAAAVGSDTLTPARLSGVVVSFVGVGIVIAGGVGFGLAGSAVGAAMTLAAAACWAIYTSFGATILRRHSPLEMSTWAIVAGTTVLAPIGLAQWVGAAPVAPGELPAIALALAYSGILAAGLANVVVFTAVRLLGPTRITALQALVPAMAVVLAFLILGEPIRPAQVIGGVVIVAGVALTRRTSPRFAAGRPV